MDSQRSINAFLDDLPPPCQDILEINHHYSETEWSKGEFIGLNVDTNFFEVNLAFPSSTYKEIVQVKAYDEESLVGYVGGYIGMFLGLGLLQVPQLISAIHKKIVSDRNARSDNNKKESKETKPNKLNNYSDPNYHNEYNGTEGEELMQPRSDIRPIKQELKDQSLVKRLDIIELKLEELITENRCRNQHIKTNNPIQRKRLHDEVLF